MKCNKLIARQDNGKISYLGIDMNTNTKIIEKLAVYEDMGEPEQLQIVIDNFKAISNDFCASQEENIVLKRALENMHKDWFFRDQRSIEDCLKEAEEQLKEEGDIEII